MKKLIAFLLVFVMLVPFTAYADDYDIIFNDSKSGSVKSQITIGGDGLNVLEVAASDEYIPSAIDMETLTEGIKNATCDLVFDYNFSDDYSSGQTGMVAELFVPVKMNNNLEITARVKTGLWFIYDVSNEADPEIKIIKMNPDSQKYVVTDIASELALYGYSKKTISSEIKKYINEQTVTEFINFEKELYMQNSNLSVKNGEYTLTMTTQQLINVYSGVMNKFSEAIGDFSKTIPEDLYRDLIASVQTDFEYDSEHLKIDTVITGQLSKDGKAENADAVFTLVINPPEGYEELGEISINVNVNTKYSPLENGKVNIPTLTAENSKQYYESDYMYDGCSYADFYGKNIPSVEGTLYVPLGDVIKNLRSNGHYCKVDNNDSVLVITCDEGENFKRVEVATGSADVMIDSARFTAANPVISDEGIIYVDNTFMEKVFGYVMDEYRIDLIDNTVSVTFERECIFDNSQYEEEYFEEYDVYPHYDICWHVQNTWVPIDAEVFKDGYFGLRNFVDSHCLDNGVCGQIEIAYDNGVVVLKNSGSAEYFKEARITVGSNIVTVDGENFEALLPAVNKNGSVYVDKETLKAIFKYELESAYISNRDEYDETINDYKNVYKEEARFKRVSPLCTHLTSVDDEGYFYY